MQIKCPKCSWQPSQTSIWACESCGLEWHIFDTAARCPTCDYDHENIYCIEWEGGCGELSPHLDWYEGMDEELLRINVQKSVDQ